MRVSILLSVVLCLLPFVIAPAVAQAVAVSIQINGTPVSSANCTTSGITTTCTIAGTYGNVEVTGDPSGAIAQVEAVDSATLPLIRLINAKFRATANAVNGSVTFSAPTGGRVGPKMIRKANGWLVRTETPPKLAPYTSPTNKGQFIVDGVVDSASMIPTPESIDAITKGGDTSGSSKVVLSTNFAHGEINGTVFTKSETMNTPGGGTLSGSRTLKGEFTFYLPVMNDYLRLSTVEVVTVNPASDESDVSFAGYTDMWDGDTARCKPKKICPGPACPKICPGPACPKVTGPHERSSN